MYNHKPLLLAAKVVSLLIALFALSGCGTKSEFDLETFAARVHDGHYTRAEMLSKFDALDTPRISRGDLRVRFIRDIAQQELKRLQVLEPAVAALVQARSSGMVVAYHKPSFETSLFEVKEFADFDALVSEARQATAFASAKLPARAKIVVENGHAQIVLVDIAQNADGVEIETKMRYDYPLGWVKTYAPKLLFSGETMTASRQ